MRSAHAHRDGGRDPSGAARRPARQATVQTGVSLTEHEWLQSVARLPVNDQPRFRFPDLLSACVTLILTREAGEDALAHFLSTDFLRRFPILLRRSCDIWPAQFELVTHAHRAAWNRFPNPKFSIDQITSGCVALVRELNDPELQVLAMARVNLAARSVPAPDFVGGLA